MCKWNASPLPTPPPPGDCPEGWEDIGGEKCYMHQDFPVQQAEKNIYCVNQKIFAVVVARGEHGVLAGDRGRGQTRQPGQHTLTGGE